ncbi:hypothetical protein V2S66_00360 [Streptomyces sp. V4-01]|uniref:PRC-barrel domain-containing protein n=1 Tax=Actinacidiphila polyblastidii TaxID=3110430 RepID=A0ABU7P3N5_9ACTN|nr:hypothetical protein [Streptomyces sp. V4-01]
MSDEQEVQADPEAVRRLAVHDVDGRRVGPVTQVYLDDRSRRPEWVAVRVSRTDPPVADSGAAATQEGGTVPEGARNGAGEPVGSAEVFVPLRGARRERGDVLRVGQLLEVIGRAPVMNVDQHLGLDQEQELYVHYGLTPRDGDGSGAPGVGDGRPMVPLTGPARDEVVSRVRELADEPPAAPARLRRFVPTDSDEATVGPSGVHGDDR